MVTDFSDQELAELELVARNEFEEHSNAGWTVIEIRRSTHPGRAELVIESPDRQQTVVLVNRSEYEEENTANGSDLSDVAFNFSVRLLEYNGILGFGTFAGKSTADLELCPPDEPGLPPAPEGMTRNLRSPFYP